MFQNNNSKTNCLDIDDTQKKSGGIARVVPKCIPAAAAYLI